MDSERPASVLPSKIDSLDPHPQADAETRQVFKMLEGVGGEGAEPFGRF
jgi:hypothetical protein